MQHKTFLEEVAESLYSRYGNDISSLTLVFPSRRARLFFSDALSRLIERPIWQPHYISMDDIMCQASSYTTGDKVRLITELYKIYAEYHPAETFDKFYFWGDVLLSDFDLIDKYMIDADMLFRNLCDLKELEADLSYLTPEMRQVISSFWSHFTPLESLTEEKQKFLSIWLSLAPVYHRFQERLRELKAAYTGMIYRSAVDNIEAGTGAPDTSRHYVFIGFNALSECEKRMLKYLSLNSECDFFWDYDSYYTSQSEQEAGHFLRENISKHKASCEITHDNMLGINKKLTAISCVSNVVQCKYVNTLLHEISPALQFDKQTAIVLTDEALLMPLLHSLPAEISKQVNVTMGYPLRQTSAYSLIERLIDLQKNTRKSNNKITFYHTDVNGVLSHPYITEAFGEEARKLQHKINDGRYIRIEKEFFDGHDGLSSIFLATNNCSELSEYILEVFNMLVQRMDKQMEDYTLRLSYISLIADNINKLGNCLKDCDIEISTSIYTSLLRRHLQNVRIPFSGEPLNGLQVMGILETRNIDFRNVIILSMNDDNFPSNITGSSSFIPYNLRAAYGMPTPEHHESVYAYYFYRLIQRAERVDMLYCSHADDKSTGEQSRYIYQLDYESPYPIERINVGVDVTVGQAPDNEVAKCGSVRERLMQFLGSDNKVRLSPTAFARYVTCPMKFYFASVARIKSVDELSEEIDYPMFGTILHAAMQRLYTPIKGVVNPAKLMQRMLDTDEVERAVTEAVNENYLKNSATDQSNYSGSLMLVKNIIISYIRNGIIPYDIQHNAFAVEQVEEDIEWALPIGNGRSVRFGGIADRIDSLDNGALRVVDYKTGRPHQSINGIESLFEGTDRSHYGNILQTMIYSMVLNHTRQRNVYPTLYYARIMGKEEFSPTLIDLGKREADSTKRKKSEAVEIDYAAYATEFETLLSQKLNELFDFDTPFRRCDEQEAEKICELCEFKTICKR
ncbi:MAG: PD-(D/E)XK nuclease family protein [Alistipes sp.]|nr:PD-(D/E)XK nuclease family protein [Alistipes sp.]